MDNTMSLFSKLAQLDKRYALSFFGFILAAIFGGITIYTEFYRDNTPEIKTEIIANASILDIKENIQDLQVIYQEEDIKKTHKNLSSLLIKVSNTGRSPILSTYYDESSPFGLQIFYCEILKVELISASNEYLSKKLSSKKIVDDLFILPKVIFEPGDYIILKFLLMHPESQTVKAAPVGKVASTKFLKVLETFRQDEKKSFLQQVLSGTFLVHIARIPVYFVIFILSIFVVVLPPLFISEKLQERSRKKTVRTYKAHTNIDLNSDSDKIFNFYISNGLSSLSKAKKLLSQEDKLSALITEYIKYDREGKLTDHFEKMIVHERTGMRKEIPSLWLINELIELSLIKITDENYEIEEQPRMLLDDFVDFVVIKQS